jgi:putative intracellular protease/amidase
MIWISQTLAAYSYLDVRAVGIWDDFYVVDGRLVTGQNPASASSTAASAVAVFETL